MVQVNASSVQLNTDNSTVSGVTPSQVIDVIPNLDNNPLQYLELQNGITPALETQNTQNAGSTTNPNAFGIGVAGRQESSAFAVNGGRAFENEIEIDGLPDTGQGFNEATVLPNLEGIQEFRPSPTTSARNMAMAPASSSSRQNPAATSFTARLLTKTATKL